MTILQIKRDTGTNANNIPIVRVQTTSFLQDIFKMGWLTTQEPSLTIVNDGAFQWDAEDVLLIETFDPVTLEPVYRAWGFISPDFTTVIPIAPIYPTLQQITANPGGGQANATVINIGSNDVYFSGAPGDSVKLPLDVLGQTVNVKNRTANAIDVFPQVGDSLNGVLNGSVSVPAGLTRMFIGTGTLEWYSFG